MQGIVIGGYGISSTIWSQMQLLIVNPDNVDAEPEVEGGEAFFDDPEVLGRVPTLLGTMTALYATLMTFGNVSCNIKDHFTVLVVTINVFQSAAGILMMSEPPPKVRLVILLLFTRSVNML